MEGKILIADDDEQSLGSLSRILAGYDVFCASDGNTALEMAGSENPDLVLLDVDMPGMNGLEVLKKLAAMRRRPLVIMITGDGSSETVSKAMAQGVFSYMIKPLEREDVLDQVRRALALRAAGGRD
ncbi:MAG: response regulator [Elusimicrobia bacterium]|nr:response regulator [Elusimicrobiota bacterium]